VEHAQDAKGTLKRILKYFSREKKIVATMIIVVLFGTICGVFAPSLQSKAIDIIAGSRGGTLAKTIIFMLSVYAVYAASQLIQGFLSANLSQRIVGRMRDELFGKIMDLPIKYLDEHSHIDNSFTVITFPYFGSAYYCRDSYYNAVVLLAVGTFKLWYSHTHAFGYKDIVWQGEKIFT
jgi:ABC-type multidrug transport system fused ATPase/permease subunit